jgi:D-methionine transport system substrate-binding protein
MNQFAPHTFHLAHRFSAVRRLTLAAAASLALAFAAPSAIAKDRPLKVGTATSPAVEALQLAAKLAKAQGLEVEIIEFNDWNTPNSALANDDIDVNYFQHIPFLENAKKQGGYDFVSVGVGTISKLGLYSKKWKSFDQIPVSGKVAIAGDPVNGGRGLLLLERAGLIKLKPGVGYKATLLDITANPKKLQIVQIEALQLARSLGELDLAQGYPAFLKLAGEDPRAALLFDGLDNKEYALQWVVRPAKANDARIRQFIAIYQKSPEVRAVLDRLFGDLYAVAW